MSYGALKAATFIKPVGPTVVLADDLARLPFTPDGGNDKPLYRPGDGFRSLFADPEFAALGIVDGYSDFVRLSDGFLLRVFQATTSRPLSHTTCGDRWLRLQFWTDDVHTVLFDRHGQADLRGGACMVNYHAPGLDKSEWLFGKGAAGTAVTIYCSPAFIARTFGPEFDALPRCVQDYMLGTPPELIFQALPLRPDMMRVLTDVVQTPYRGALAARFSRRQGDGTRQPSVRRFGWRGRRARLRRAAQRARYRAPEPCARAARSPCFGSADHRDSGAPGRPQPAAS